MVIKNKIIKVSTRAKIHDVIKIFTRTLLDRLRNTDNDKNSASAIFVSQISCNTLLMADSKI